MPALLFGTEEAPKAIPQAGGDVQLNPAALFYVSEICISPPLMFGQM